mmetsp:Transcript_14091/g.29664  ORF Transcript_14091/g.29664 Transcript_14091/m.29664 type:complete len:129 (-) Transcript_14091:512-898(-)
MTHEWMEYFRAPDTNIDKALQYPSMESNECISTCPDTKGVMTFCLWKVPITMTMTGFQDFIDRFTRGYATSKCYAVDAAMGNQNLDPRGYKIRNQFCQWAESGLPRCTNAVVCASSRHRCRRMGEDHG